MEITANLPSSEKIPSLSWNKFAIILILPLALGFLTYFFFGRSLTLTASSANYGVGSMIWLIVIIDTMHVFATLFFLKKNPEVRVKLGYRIWFLPLAVIGTSYVVFFFSWQLLLRITAYIVLLHTILQQFGWFQKSFDSFVDKNTYLLYKIIFFSCTIMPVLYWHTGLNGFGSWYFFNNVIVFFIPPVLGPPLIAATISVILGSLAILSLKRQLFLKPIMLLAITWFIYFYGIVFSDSLLFFIFCLVFSHSGSYILFTYQSILDHKNNLDITKKKLDNVFLQAFILISISALWMYGLRNYLNVRDYLIPLQLVPTTFHLAFDSFIWRKTYRASTS